MARIPVYQVQEGNPQPLAKEPPITAIGDALVEGGKETGSAIEGLQKRLHQKQVSSEISQVSAAASMTMANLSDNWNQTRLKANPNDPTVANTWAQTNLQPALSKLDDIATTDEAKNHLTELKATVASHFLKTTSSDMAQMSADAHVLNYTKGTGALSSMVAADPTAMNSALAMHDASLKALTGFVDANKIEELRSEGQKNIVTSAMQGAIDKNPWAAEHELTAGHVSQYLDGNKIAQLLNETHREQRERQTEVRVNQEWNEHQNRRAAEAQSDSIIANIVDPKTGKFTATPEAFKALDNPAFKTPEGKSQLVSTFKFLQQVHKENVAGSEGQSDPDAVSGFLKRMGPQSQNLPTTQELQQSVADGNMSLKDYKSLASHLNDVQSDGTKYETHVVDDTLKSFKDAISGGMLKDPEAAQRVNQFDLDAHDYIRSMRTNGYTLRDLLDPKNPAYVGNLAQKYILSPQEQTKALSQSLSGGPLVYEGPKGQPGESPSNAAQPKTQKDFDALHGGSWYIDPVSHQSRQKKGSK